MSNRHDVPATSKNVPGCRISNCGQPSYNTIEGKVEVMGKLLTVKLPVCPTHFEGVSCDQFSAVMDRARVVPTD
jgi:hypothetical protein